MTAKQSIAWLQAAWKDDKKRINLLLVSGLAGMPRRAASRARRQRSMNSSWKPALPP